MAKFDWGRMAKTVADNPEIQEALKGTLGSGQRSGPPPAPGDSKKSKLDQLQFIADVAGVADPSGIVDAANAAVYLGRAVGVQGEERQEHLKNALISGISIIPYVGDLAKAAKYGKGATKAGGGVTPPVPPGGGGSGSLGRLGQGAIIGGMAGGAAAMFGGGMMPRGSPDDRRYTMFGEFAGPTGQLLREDTGRLMGRNWKTVKDILNPLVGPISKVSSIFSTLYRNTTELPGLVHAWGDALKNSQEHLTAFSGEISVAFMGAHKADILRNIRSGRATGASTSDMIKSLNEFKDVTQWIRDDVTVIKNKLTTALLSFATMSARYLPPILEGILRSRATGLALLEIAKYFHTSDKARTAQSMADALGTPGVETMKWFREYRPSPPPTGGGGPGTPPSGSPTGGPIT